MADTIISENQLRSIYRQYDLKALLQAINRETYLLANNDDIMVPGMKQIDRGIKIGKSHLGYKYTSIISASDLIDVSYYAIQFTNESRGETIITEDDLIKLLAFDDRYKEQNPNRAMAWVSGTNHFHFFLWGSIGEQIRFQTINKVFSNAARDMYMLLELAPRTGIQYIEKQIREEIGAPWYVLASALHLAWVGFAHVNELEEMIPCIRWNSEFTQDKYIAIIDRYSASYSEIRKSTLKRQVFYTKPYIKTKTGTISISYFLNLFAYEHCLFWTIRNRYLREESQLFLNDFGVLFEKYFEETLQTYLCENDYSKIEPDGKKPLADWKMNLCGYTFLVEQKSALMSLEIKQPETNIYKFERYAAKIIEAIRQLHSTEQAEGRECIKIILLYEDYIKPELLDNVFLLEQCNIANDHRYWLVTIDEMERLLYLYKHKQQAFIQLIEEKNRREKGQLPPGESKGLDRMLFSYDKAENRHLRRKQFKKYEQIVENYIKQLVDKT